MHFYAGVLCRVRFEGEDARDEGGVSRELMTLAVAELLTRNTFLSPCGSESQSSSLLWFNGTASGNDLEEESTDEFFFGVLVGLACYNNLYIDVPLPPAIYKIMTDNEVICMIIRIIFLQL